jgi:hypothetical protein
VLRHEWNRRFLFGSSALPMGMDGTKNVKRKHSVYRTFIAGMALTCNVCGRPTLTGCAAENAMNAIRSYWSATMVLLLWVSWAAAQLPPPTVVPPAPNPNPGNSLVLPPVHQVPVSPGLGGGGREDFSLLHPYYSVCSVFRRRPCFPDYLPPIGQDLRLTIVSSDEAASRPENEEVAAADKHPLDSIRDMFAALRACWVPPPKDEARHGMEYTIRFALKRDGTMVAPPRMTYSSHDVPASTRDAYRDAIDAALKRCTPLNFSDGMAGAVAGRPIAIRFVDDRTVDPQQKLR